MSRIGWRIVLGRLSTSIMNMSIVMGVSGMKMAIMKCPLPMDTMHQQRQPRQAMRIIIRTGATTTLE